jgi:bacteriorhodopsin
MSAHQTWSAASTFNSRSKYGYFACEACGWLVQRFGATAEMPASLISRRNRLRLITTPARRISTSSLRCP